MHLAKRTITLFVLGSFACGTHAIASNITTEKEFKDSNTHGIQTHHRQEYSNNVLQKKKEHDDTHDEPEHEHEHEHEHEDHLETISIVSTRTGRSVQEEPIRVEIINQEELLEKAMMRPGNISMLVAETGGVRVQTTSPALGAANIRLQGLYGRYTQLLSDGLPLYGGQAASIGLLQIPPTDLSRVEIIKGSASSLYGGSAMGGVINLISRRPTDEAQGELLINLTSRDGQDMTSYVAAPLNENTGLSFTAGAHHQAIQDLDDDGWIDMAGFERYTARPRLFWENDEGTSVYATAGLMTENRRGGTASGETLQNGQAFEQNQDSERFDGGIIAEGLVNELIAWQTRASAMLQRHDKVFGPQIEQDEHESFLLEASLKGYSDNSQWVIGLAFQEEGFDSTQFSQFNYRYKTPGIFAQADYALSERFSTAVSARLDDHSEFGKQFSPRISFLYKPEAITVRASYGQGYFAPTPFVEEIEAAGLGRLAPLQGLEEERAVTASLDVSYQADKLESSLTFFNSNIEGVTQLVPFSRSSDGDLNAVRLINAEGDSRIFGSELLFRYKWHDFKLTASYLFLDTSEFDAGEQARRPISLTPKHSAGFVAMWERHGEFLLGFEAYFTGTQQLDGNPYRDESDAYWHLGILGEKTIGAYSFFINFENLLNIRQTKEDSLVLPNRAPNGQWTTDIWSRNDGFIVNAGVRIRFGAH